MASGKKPKAVPNPNPLGLTTREAEIAVLAWRDTPTTTRASHPSKWRHPLGAPRESKQVTDNLWSRAKQINKHQLEILGGFGNAESAGRVFRTVKAKIMDAKVESTAVPGTPTNGAGGNDAATAAAVAANPESPSLLASQKKQKKAATGGKVAGRKRTMKEADEGESGDDGDKNGAEGSKRPKKAAKIVKGEPSVTLNKAAEGGIDDLKDGEV